MSTGLNRIHKSLSGKTSTGAGSSVNFGDPQSRLALQVTHTGSPTTCVVTLEGSLNGTNWFVIATWTTLTSGDIVFAVDKPVVSARANLTTLAGGTAPAVSAWVAGSE